MSIKIFGLAAFREAVTRGFRLAEAAEGIVREMDDWEVVTPAQMAILSFRYAPPGRTPAALDALNREIVATMFDETWNYGFPQEMEHFVRCMRGEDEPRSTGEDGRAVLEAVIAAYASAGRGERIVLPYAGARDVKRPIEAWKR